jgi:hypothetical protein
MLNTSTNTLTYHRVPYDSKATVNKIRAAGLPERFVVLLEQGS